MCTCCGQSSQARQSPVSFPSSIQKQGICPYVGNSTCNLVLPRICEAILMGQICFLSRIEASNLLLLAAFDDGHALIVLVVPA